MPVPVGHKGYFIPDPLAPNSVVKPYLTLLCTSRFLDRVDP